MDPNFDPTAWLSVTSAAALVEPGLLKAPISRADSLDDTGDRARFSQGGKREERWTFYRDCDARGRLALFPVEDCVSTELGVITFIF